MNKNLSKLDASNQKRLESLRQKTNEFKLKKETIRNDLSKLDTDNRKPAAKRITFDSSSESEPEEKKKPRPAAVKEKAADLGVKRKSNNLFNDDESDDEYVKAAPASTSKNKSSAKKDKISLIDNDDGDSDADDYDAKKAFESKINLDEKKANKLIQLKSKYANDNSRFKIDDRFVDDSESGSDSSEDEKPVTKSGGGGGGNDEDDDEEEGERPEDISEKKLKKEKTAALKILESITGKTIINRSSEADSSFRSQNKVKQMIRYDPSKDEHKQFEVRDSSDEEIDVKAKAKKSKDAAKSDSDGEQNGHAEVLVNEEKFYQVEPNIKEIFESAAKDANSGFQFNFEHVEKDLAKKVDKFSLNDYNDEIAPAAKSLPKSLEERFKSKYSSSSESESEQEPNEEDDEEEEENGFEEDRDSDASFPRPTKTVSETTTSSLLKKTKPLPKSTGPPPKIDCFLPRADDKDIVEALKFFCRAQEVDELREEWQKKRNVLVEECKKKHKRVLRIKKTNDNKKILPWKSSHSKNKK